MTRLTPRIRSPLLVAALCCAAGLPAAAQVVDDVFPVAPENGETVGIRPTFQIGVEGMDILDMRFRIELSEDDFDTLAYEYDQKEDRAGWAFNLMTDLDGAVYRTRKPIADGDYLWRVWAWNGVEWIEGDTVYRLLVDGTRPADVENVRLSRTPEGGIALSWDPVTIDLNGRPEYVVRYHVYRWLRKRWVFMRAFEVGTTELPVFEDNTEVTIAAPILFYKVTAEDAAGNHEMKRWEYEKVSPEDEKAAARRGER